MVLGDLYSLLYLGMFMSTVIFFTHCTVVPLRSQMNQQADRQVGDSSHFSTEHGTYVYNIKQKSEKIINYQFHGFLTLSGQKQNQEQIWLLSLFIKLILFIVIHYLEKYLPVIIQRFLDNKNFLVLQDLNDITAVYIHSARGTYLTGTAP